MHEHIRGRIGDDQQVVHKWFKLGFTFSHNQFCRIGSYHQFRCILGRHHLITVFHFRLVNHLSNIGRWFCHVAIGSGHLFGLVPDILARIEVIGVLFGIHDQRIGRVDNSLVRCIFDFPQHRIAINRNQQRRVVAINNFRRIHIQVIRRRNLFLGRLQRSQQIIQ